MEKQINIKDLNKHEDSRGKIQMVFESCNIGSVSIISTEPNNFRANHYHRNDQHHILINEGQILIYERIVGSKSVPNLFILNKGDIHLTSPMIEHMMFFPCFSIFTCFSKLSRDSEHYENDTVRFSHNLKEIYDNYIKGNIND